MYLKKFLNQPNAVGAVLITLLFCAGIVFTFGFDGFNVETVSDSEAEALLRLSMSGCCGGGDGDDDDDDDDDFDCKCLTDAAGNKVSCGACESEEDKCSGSKTPSSCIDGCDGDFCNDDNDGYCGSENAVHDEYCPKDPDANEYYCEEDTSGCSEENN